MTRRELFAIGVSVGISPLAKAQQRVETSDEEVVIKGGVELVNILATVRGKNNAIIRNLQASDFKILEDGKEQPIREVVGEAKLPLMLGMLIDLSGSMSVHIPDEKTAGARFFRQVLRPKDRAFAAIFRNQVEMLQDVTGDAGELEAGLNRIAYDRAQAGRTALYDAIYLSCEQRLKGEHQRRVLIVLSDGQDFGSRSTLNDAIRVAQTTESVIYTITFVGAELLPARH
jgi:VWFA-related protein